MRNKIFCLALGATLFALSFPAEAQQPKKIARVGWLTIGPRSMIPERYEAFRQGLRDLGYIEGQNLVIERTNADGKLHRLADAAAELVRLNVDVIVTTHNGGFRSETGHKHHPDRYDNRRPSGDGNHY